MEVSVFTVLSVIILHQLLQGVCCFVNLSIKKKADMSSSQYSDKWLAGEAVDGDVSQKVAQDSCAVTSDNFHKQAWWRVDLGDIYVLNSIKIYYRKESEDSGESLTYWLSGFSIYVADTLNWWIGTRCYLHNNGQHTNPGPSDILTVPCNATGRYVTVYKQRNESCVWNPHYYSKLLCVKLDLCEVQVLGCEDGTYGESCSNICSGNCLYGDHCNKAHGGCDDGCVPGYRGFYCNDECNGGTFGLKCLNECGKCKTKQCNHIDGTCPTGCVPGWKGIVCNETCAIGSFGLDCKDTCSQYCSSNRMCNHVNGTCDRGCQAGWMNHNCNQTCPPGMYGDNCKFKCNEKCRDITKCRKTDGYCEKCSEGWIGHFCDEECTMGLFGYDCSSVCGHCVGDICFHTNGSCRFGCSPGWKGFYCNETCNQGLYGDHCSRMCKSCKETCHHVTGNCLAYEHSNDSTVIAISVTSVVIIATLAVVLLLTCVRRTNKCKQHMEGDSTINTVQQRHVQMSNKHGDTPNTQNARIQDTVTETKNRVSYENHLSTITDSNTYESLQEGRGAIYTNTEITWQS